MSFQLQPVKHDFSMQEVITQQSLYFSLIITKFKWETPLIEVSFLHILLLKADTEENFILVILFEVIA